MDVLYLKNMTNMKDKSTRIADLKAIIEPYVQDKEALENLNEETDFINDLKSCAIR